MFPLVGRTPILMAAKLIVGKTAGGPSMSVIGMFQQLALALST
jgi:hypothetical protein